MNTKLLLAIIIFGLVFAFFIFNGNNTDQKEEPTVTTQIGEEVLIILTKEGYVPNEVAIKKGDTVVWKNETESLFWPASNLHPSHRDYPGGAFDPKKPIESGDTWSFTFTEVGDWKYHDHLAPYFTGVVYVEE